MREESPAASQLDLLSIYRCVERFESQMIGFRGSVLYQGGCDQLQRG
jgi:hypothetical protein